MKIQTPAKIAVAILAVILTGTVALAATRHQNPLQLVGLQPASTPAPSPSPLATATPTASPSTTPAQSASPKPSTTPERYLDAKFGRCEGINASDDECVTKDTAKLEIASVILPVASVTCTASTVDVAFSQAVLTRHYLAGGAGTAAIQIDFSDGTSSPVYIANFATNTNQQLISGITHQFPVVSPGSYSFRVRLLSPNQITLGFSPIHLSASPSCSN